MCGIAGFLAVRTGNGDSPQVVAQRMATALAHRGPDAEGVWVDEVAGIALAHRRLAIVDLSAAGQQPMSSHDGRYILIFNGEIYNHVEVRQQLDAQDSSVRWRGRSDTEVLVAAISAWGLEETLRRCVGMFALAVWDRATRTLHLARDRLGEKPLYYGWQTSNGRRAFLFASELKALKVHPSFAAEINRDAITLFLRHNYVPAPHSIFSGIHKLVPGTILTVSEGHNEPRTTTYWSALRTAKEAHANPFVGTPESAVDTLEELLRQSIAGQMVADVPLGVFLSGGIDSSTIAALMQTQSATPIRTFTIGFGERTHNEADYAAAVAKHLGTEHTELYVEPQAALDVIPNLPSIYDEPFADSSQIPTFLVSKMAREHVTVCLSGDAGDELFGGYNRYTLTDRTWRTISALPHDLRRLIGGAVTSIPTGAWNALAHVPQAILPMHRRLANFGDKMHKAAGVLSSRSADELYLGLISHWADPSSLVIGAREPDTILRAPPAEVSSFGEVERMMALDLVTYLPDDILAKVDRASMAVSLETRVPLLDHRIVELAWRLPYAFKVRAGTSKWVLRQVLHRYVPRHLIERPKLGFGVPINSWLRGPLREWAEELLSESALRDQGLLDPCPIRSKWTEHQTGKRDWGYHLWDVLMLQAWLKNQ